MSSYDQLKKSSLLSGGNATFIESLYESFLENPDSVSDYWQAYFKQINGNTIEKPRLVIQEKFEVLAKLPKNIVASSDASPKQASVLNLIAAYRNSGHSAADTDPLRFRVKKEVVDLNPAFHGLTDNDMDEVFDVGTLFTNQQQMKLKDIIAFLKSAYTKTIGVECSHLHDIEEKRWVQERIESYVNYKTNPDSKKAILENLVKAEGLERYLHTRYVGQKRFSLEGGESLIPLMDELIQNIGENGGNEVVIGMAHRGRLNVLINIMGKLPSQLFNEFEGKTVREDMPGDVKYHMGFSSEVETKGGNVHLALAFNPSHLEIVNPVIQGSVRARLERRKKTSGGGTVMAEANSCIPVQIHGDAAFAGQGVIQETLQLSQVRGYRVGGTIHVIINNMIGFTTSNLLDARSSQYSSDPAKIVQSPVIHVNGDDPEAVVYVTKIAADYLFKYKKDIVIDLMCYRRLGHNEADEPATTQPMMYKNIRNRDTTLTVYANKLINEKTTTEDEVSHLKETYKHNLESGVSVARPIPTDAESPAVKEWQSFSRQDWYSPVDTKVNKKTILSLAKKIFIPPKTFTPHPIVQKLLENRLKMANGEVDLDWGFAENMAYATLLNEGYQVRLSGEDCGRGTFSHRHAVIHDYQTGDSYMGLGHISDKQPSCRVIDSILSEEAVLAFEYGFATKEPNSLTIWEAQFGDFANGAQVVFDQFISAGEAKWARYCGLTVFLPHGYEGQGPEHSSARLERYLQLCADNNMRVCIPSTPAQTFHMLRRQMHQTFRKPLIVMTPKSLLRHKLAINTLDDLTTGKFQTILSEIDDIKAAKVERIIFCSGKVYYDLLEERRQRKLENIAIIRIEEIYPFPRKGYQEQIDNYPKAKQIVWCQEEPENQGAWRQIQHELIANNSKNLPVTYVGRKQSASTAAGYPSIHKKEQAELINNALTI